MLVITCGREIDRMGKKNMPSLRDLRVIFDVLNYQHTTPNGVSRERKRDKVNWYGRIPHFLHCHSYRLTRQAYCFFHA